jgi:hypothetical protein
MGFSGSSPHPGYQTPGAMGYSWVVSEDGVGVAADSSLVCTGVLKPKTPTRKAIPKKIYFILHPPFI